MIPSQRHLFDIPREVAYLNCAYMSPLLHAAVETGRRAFALKARPWQIAPPDFFALPDAARRAFAQIIGGDPEGVALVPSASYGLATAAANVAIGAGDRILIIKD